MMPSGRRGAQKGINRVEDAIGASQVSSSKATSSTQWRLDVLDLTC
jgi:hypothetical protein